MCKYYRNVLQGLRCTEDWIEIWGEEISQGSSWHSSRTQEAWSGFQHKPRLSTMLPSHGCFPVLQVAGFTGNMPALETVDGIYCQSSMFFSSKLYDKISILENWTVAKLAAFCGKKKVFFFVKVSSMHPLN